MPLGTDDTQTAECFNLLLLFRAFFLIFFQKLLEHFTRMQQLRIITRHEAGRERNLLVGKLLRLHFAFRLKFRIAAQNNVGTTTSHIGRDRDSA